MNLSLVTKGSLILFCRKQLTKVFYKLSCTPVLLPRKSHGWRALVGCSPWVATSRTRLSNFPFTFHFHAMEKEMATHSSVLAWRIPGTAEPGGLPSMGSHRVGRDWSDLAAVAAAACTLTLLKMEQRESEGKAATVTIKLQGNILLPSFLMAYNCLTMLC